MSKRKTKRSERQTKAHKTIKQHQQNENTQDHHNGIGPLLVGRSTEPGDLDLHIEYISEIRSSRRGLGFRLQLTKLAMVVLVLGLLLAAAVVQHDRELVHEGLEAFKAIFGSTSGIHTSSLASSRKATSRKPSESGVSHGEKRGDWDQ
jgi:hypothetical protein